MNKKYLLTLLVVCIFAGAYLLERAIQPLANRPETPPALVIEENIPEKGFKDLQITYYGDTGRYRMDTSLDSIVEETDSSLEFRGLAAILKDGDKILQRFSTPAGSLVNQKGLIELNGPVFLKAGNYEISLNTVNVDLNHGQLSATGPIQVRTENMQIYAEKMQTDFSMLQLTFKGRPRVIITTKTF